MKIAVFGATGQTGLEFVKQALTANHHVTALVRSPEKMGLTNDNLNVIKVDVLDPTSFSEKLVGHDAVVSCLGFAPQKPAVTGYTTATKGIVEAMRGNGQKRLVLCHSWYTEMESRGQAIFFIRWVLLPMIKTVLNNMFETEEWLNKECSDIEYTVVRPAGLQNKPVTTAEIKVAEGGYHIPEAAGRIARADVARFMLSCVDKDEFKGKQLAIGI